MSEKEIKLGSLFDGIGGFPFVASMYGIVPVWASEIEAFPISITKRHFPNMKHLGDICRINGAQIEPVDIITGGSPCFPADTLILTDNGLIPIQNIIVGMRVLTHTGQYQMVTDTGSRISRTITLRGNHYGLICTSDHPIYSAEAEKPRLLGRNNSVKLKSYGNWTSARNMLGRYWAASKEFPMLPVPDIDVSDSVKISIDENLFYVVGRWIGDGWIRNYHPQTSTDGQIVICVNKDKTDSLVEIIESVCGTPAIFHERAFNECKIRNRSVCKWVTDNFGNTASGKRIPAWALGMKEKFREALLQGIFDSEEWKTNGRMYRATVDSRNLALGIRFLAESLGYQTALERETRINEFEDIVPRIEYQITCSPADKSRCMETEMHRWYKVNEIQEHGDSVRVYNLSVENDNSYTADGVVVHNCQNFSIAGNRQGLSGEKSILFMQMIRIIREMREATNGKYPSYVIWENVGGSKSSNNGKDFREVVEEFCSIQGSRANVPQPAKWADAGMVSGDEYSFGWRMLDASFMGVPQRRRRIYAVLALNDPTGKRAGEILFDTEGKGRYSESSDAPWKKTAGNSGNSSEAIDNTDQDQHGYIAAFMGGQGKKAGGIAWNEKVSPTLKASPSGSNMVPSVCVEQENSDNPDVLSFHLTQNPIYSSVRTPCLSSGNSDHGQAVVGIAIREHDEHSNDGRHAYQSTRFGEYREGVGTLRSNGGDSGGGSETLIAGKCIVRKMTPLECERLQGYPDNWTALGEHGESISDTARYKAIGNSVALPCVDYVIRGILSQMDQQHRELITSL